MGKKRNPTKAVAQPRRDPKLEIKSECMRSMTVLRRGSHAKALRLMREILRKHGDSALAHRAQAAMHSYISGFIENSTAKQKHISSAIESVKRATELAPNSVEFAYFYAFLLFEHKAENEGCELVLAECERALSIESPIHPAEEYLDISEETAASTLEARISQVQAKLKILVQKCNLASISTETDTLNEEKCGPEHRAPTSPTAPPPGRNNEINKASKTLDEHRKEIEVRVAAARLLQQQRADPGQSPPTTSSGPNNEEEHSPAAAAASSSSSEEEKNHLIPVHSSNEQVEYSVTKGPTAPLPRRYSVIKNASKSFAEEIEECVSAAQKMQQQRADPDQSSSTTLSGLHIEKEHSTTASSVSPSPPSGFNKPVSRKLVNSFSSNHMDQVRAYWNSMTTERQLSLLRASIPDMKSHYASFDENAMMDLVSEALSFAEESGSWEFWICFKCNEKFSDAISHLNHVSAHIGTMSDLAMEAIPEEVNPDWVGMLTNTSLKPIDVESLIRSSDEACNRNCNLLKDTDSGNSNYASPFNCFERGIKENGDCNGFEKMDCVVSDGDNAGGRLHKWPLSDDPEREELLEKIQSMLGLMIKHRCLSTRHVRKLLEFANNQIKAYPLPSNVLDSCGDKLERTPLGLCFLDASMLRAVFCVLQELSHTGGLQRSAEKDSSAVDADGTTKNGIDLETLKLDLKSSTLTVGGAEGERVLRDANSLFQWIYAGPSIADRLAAWACSKEEKSNQVVKLVQTLEKELSLCQTFCEKKLEYLVTLHMLENLREEKGLIQRYDLITDILNTGKDNLNAELNKLDVQIMRGVAGMHLLELKLGPASLFDYRFVLIPLIKSFVRSRLEELADKDRPDDAGRSDAAREAFLAELAKNDKKSSWKGEAKQSNEKSKDNKKGRDYRISKSPKGSTMETVIHEERAEKSEVPLSDNMGGITTDKALNQDAEEAKRKVEIEAEERKLDEILEYQRRLEKTLEYLEETKKQQSQFKAIIGIYRDDPWR